MLRLLAVGALSLALVVLAYWVADRSDQSNSAQVVAALTGTTAVAVASISGLFNRWTTQDQAAARARGALRAEIVGARAPAAERLREAMTRVSLQLQGSWLRVASQAGAASATQASSARLAARRMFDHALDGEAGSMNSEVVIAGLSEGEIRAAAKRWFDAGQSLAEVSAEFDQQVEGGAEPRKLWSAFSQQWDQRKPDFEAATEDLAVELERFATAQDFA